MQHQGDVRALDEAHQVGRSAWASRLRAAQAGTLPVGDQVVSKASGEERLDLRNCARTLSNGHVES